MMNGTVLAQLNQEQNMTITTETRHGAATILDALRLILKRDPADSLES